MAKDVCIMHNDRPAVGYCAFCGVPVCDDCHEGAFCKTCINDPPKSKRKALVLAIFLGWLGVHRYYMGFYFTGVIYTLTLGLFGIGWALDVIRILCWSSIDVNMQPYYTGDYGPRCTIGIKTNQSSGSFLGDLGRSFGDAFAESISSNTKEWLDMRYWRDKYRRPLLRFDQKSLTE